MDIKHRPYPPPSGPWIMAQTWTDLLFAHWPVDAEHLRSLIPAQLLLDTYDGRAWVGLTPFHLSNLRPRGLPPFPWVSAFPELNLRTYVTVRGRPGIYFFSLDAGNPLAVFGARISYRLPYFRARMSIRREGDRLHYASYRTHNNAPRARFRARYRPISAVFQVQPGSLEYFLTERYCLYTVGSTGRVYRGEIHHRPWPLQAAEAEIITNTLTSAHGIQLPDAPPFLHFARRVDMVAWPPLRVGGEHVT